MNPSNARRVFARRLPLCVVALSLLTASLPTYKNFFHASAQQTAVAFRNFESPQVHPLALTPDGTRLLAVNSPNGTLSVFQLGGAVPMLTAEIPVGLEPVSVAARNDREAWVVNWLSDSVSIVDLASGNVKRTIDVGDEPTDVLFAGLSSEMAFVCVSGGGGQTVSGRRITGSGGVVKVFDPSNPTAAPQVIDIFGKQPRALARDAAGGQVFVSVFESGNQTTLIPEPVVAQQGGLPAPNPSLRVGLSPAPSTSLIVKWNGSAWADETGDTKWDAHVTYRLADIDLVTINATSGLRETSAIAQVRGLATHVGNMAFDPTTSRLFVANLESDSIRRFEPNLRGRFQASRVSILATSPGGIPSLTSVHDLNPHVDFNNAAGTDAERALSLAMPGDIARASDGTVYVAATSSAKVGFLAPTGVVQGRINVGQGPTGLALDEARNRLYVLNRFDMTLSLVNTVTKTQTATVALGFNPEPAAVRLGRRFLYDAATFSAHGTVSCASCHLSGHNDGLAWDLGDPQGDVILLSGAQHPMKGPMLTQTLRGIIGTEPFHWRGDKRNLSEFNGAFVSLLGGPRLLTPDEMTAFTNFVRTLAFPPNPNQNLDRTFPNPSTGTSAERGATLFRNGPTLTGLVCNSCHRSFPGFLPGNDVIVRSGGILGEPQQFKAPQMRGMYQRTGLQKPASGQPRDEQITGYGFLHDGSIDTVFNFLHNPGFNMANLPGFQPGEAGEQQRRDIEAFVLSFDSGVAPAVGLQVTVSAENKSAPEVLERINLLMQQSQSRVQQSPGTFGPNCDLVVRGIYGGAPRGFLHVGDGLFQPDSRSEAIVTLAQLLDSAGPGAELTFTGALPGTGRRLALDRDSDDTLDDDATRRTIQISGRVVGNTGQGLAGVAVRLTGAQNAVAVTDSTGRYTFGHISTTGTHTVTPTGAGLTFLPASRSVTNPTANQTAHFLAPANAPNAIDSAQFFVRQHYNDFFGREPDAAGLAFWTNQITSCGGEPNCTTARRENVSGAFFLSREFQETGFFLYRLQKASFNAIPVYASFLPDQQRLGRHVVIGQPEAEAQLSRNKAAFLDGWVARARFRAVFDQMGNAQYVDTLIANAGLTAAEVGRDALVAGLNDGGRTRPSVLFQIAEHPRFRDIERNRAFVLTEYFGYLRRNPPDPPEATLDLQGFNFWLGKLNDHGGNHISAEMVKSFIVSGEYRRRFGP
ncbi:MAG TPA: DUF4214 domain-containing protein [Pyrinomonadaceae bacterium]|nr:DUF4214 domain-containing protein [Pyrinomonadaceae bacterium]